MPHRRRWIVAHAAPIVQALSLAAACSLCLAPAPSQRILHESLLTRGKWTHDLGWPYWIGPVRGCSQFGQVERLDYVVPLRYARSAIRLRAGTYRAVVRHHKLTARGTAPLTLTATYGATTASQTTPATGLRIGAWQQTRELRFTLPTTQAVTFSFGNTDPTTIKRDWLFDSFSLERLGLHGESRDGQFGGAVGGAGDVDGDGFADVILGSRFEKPAGAARVVSGRTGALIHAFVGDRLGDDFGASVAIAGDVDGDGFADLLVGAPFAERNGVESGSARVFSGRDGQVLHTFYGDSRSVRFGTSVCGAGDVDGDGFADLVVGAPLDDNQVAETGSVRVFSGRDGGILYTFYGDSGKQWLGGSVAGAGDVNGDGHADLIAGALGGAMARVYSGRDGAVLDTLRGPASINSFGQAVDGAGDVDRDGFADLIVGAPADSSSSRDAGSAYVFSGKTGAVLFSFAGATGDRLGAAVAGVGDVNGDGFGDFALGAPGSGVPGRASVVSGRDGTEIYAARGLQPNDAFGSALAAAGDVDGDGLADLVIGAPGDDANGIDTGSARIVCWPEIYTPAAFTVSGRGAGQAFGHAVGRAGDVDGDGYDDVIVGGRAQNASVHVLSGRSGAVLHTLRTTTSGDRFGWSVDGIGDVDGDGFPDLVVGIPHATTNGTDAGSARVFSGLDGRVLFTVHGTAGDQLGASVRGVGDVDGDGSPDFVVGAPGHDQGRGLARVYQGKNGAVLHTWIGDAAGDRFGAAVSGTGDADRDGHADLLVGAEQAGASNHGRAKVFSGRDGSVLYSFDGAAGSRLGGSVSAAGDVNGDGFDDGILGVPDDDQAAPRAGSAIVFSGKDGKELHRFFGTQPNARFGTAVGTAGDVDGDGYADLLVGTPFATTGLVRVYSGRDGRLLDAVHGDRAGDEFGGSVAGIGDANCDGRADFVVGAPGDDNNGTDSGSIRTFEGRPLSPGWTATYGPPCSGSTHRLPRIGMSDRPTLGETATVTLRAAPARARAILALGDRDDRPLGGGCRLLVSPALLFTATTDARGSASPAFAVPMHSSLLGATLALQWAVEPPATRALLTSDGLAARIGSAYPK